MQIFVSTRDQSFAALSSVPRSAKYMQEDMSEETRDGHFFGSAPEIDGQCPCKRSECTGFSARGHQWRPTGPDAAATKRQSALH